MRLRQNFPRRFGEENIESDSTEDQSASALIDRKIAELGDGAGTP